MLSPAIVSRDVEAEAEVIGALAAYRIQRDWTWIELAAAMEKAGYRLSPTTLFFLVRRAGPNARPRDRTVYKIRAFLETVKAAEGRKAGRKPKPARRRASRAAAAS